MQSLGTERNAFAHKCNHTSLRSKHLPLAYIHNFTNLRRKQLPLAHIHTHNFTNLWRKQLPLAHMHTHTHTISQTSGGNSDSRLARLLADACVAQGWRAVVYNRRGHGKKGGDTCTHIDRLAHIQTHMRVRALTLELTLWILPFGSYPGYRDARGYIG